MLNRKPNPLWEDKMKTTAECPAKRPYHRPQLLIYGNVHELTLTKNNTDPIRDRSFGTPNKTK